ncbi:hypothetical protein HZH68_010741 [Vespula germanica]|uniref:Uncharacterized protein n=1 Tax=Vespula germanica TaxID=30212 RepID=A0A834JT84_VESGE|nr:hypothetical protein HZH68_010741 [Vespula germanica]
MDLPTLKIRESSGDGDGDGDGGASSEIRGVEKRYINRKKEEEEKFSAWRWGWILKPAASRHKSCNVFQMMEASLKHAWRISIENALTILLALDWHLTLRRNFSTMTRYYVQITCN